MEMHTNQHKVNRLISAEYLNVPCRLLANREGERDNTGQFALIITQLFPGRYETGDRSLVEWPARKSSASPGLSWVVKHLHEGTAVVLTSLCESPS